MRKIILSIFFVEFVFNLILSFLSYTGDNSPETRNGILKYFTEADILNGIEYERAGFFLSQIEKLLRTGIMLLVIFSPISIKIEEYFSSKAGNREWLTAAMYIGFFVFVTQILFLPFSFYFGYILEHKFNFSNMTISFWFWTEFKNFLITLIFTIIGGIIMIKLIQRFPFRWIFFVPFASLIFGIFMILVYPYTILPIFYNTKPIQEGSLKTAIIGLTQKMEIPVSKIFIIEESEYSSHTNAFFTGIGSDKKIYLYDTLVQKNTEKEIISILAHEGGHWKFNHTLLGIVQYFIESILQFSLLYFLLLKIQKDQTIPIKEFHSPSTLPLLFFLLGLIGFFFDPIASSISRYQEKQADYESLLQTSDAESFISSEIKLAQHNKSRLNAHPFITFWRASHPHTLERIKMAEEFKKR